MSTKAYVTCVKLVDEEGSELTLSLEEEFNAINIDDVGFFITKESWPVLKYQIEQMLGDLKEED